MPEWNPRANDLFVQAAEIDSPADRRLFLDQQCGGDVALRAQVESLLGAGGKIGSFLERPAVNAPPADETAAYRPLTEGPGTVIGLYKLLQHIGEGGMGVVYMAEQEAPVRRKVALKIIKPGMDSKQVVARFEAERQALGMMDHPNIARVFDAGTTDSGRPYFVMELVHGVPITEFCDANRLTPKERLALFVPVCQAIQHAHMKGVIHRDVKPSNVLVTMYDDRPVPKVIDFGVAKAVEQRLTERTLFTQYGALVGTFEYMSPEQAEMNAFGVDTRSDVYSLGVLLYELLTGTTPLERQRLRTAAFGEVVRLIKEEEPPRPSTRIGTSGTLAKVAAARKTEPGKLSDLVRGELDWIVMRCLEKDRSRRYDGAATLARDVQRYLAGDAVEACPPTLGYRLRKVYQRNRAAARVAFAFVCLGLAAVVMGAVLTVQAKRAERQALDNRDLALTARHREAEQRERADQRAAEADRERRAAVAARDSLRRTHYAVSMSLIQAAWEADNVPRALQLLDELRPGPGEGDLRGFEWHYWDRTCHAEQRIVALEKGPREDPVLRTLGTAFNRDATIFAWFQATIGPRDRSATIYLLDAGTGRLLRTLRLAEEIRKQFPSDELWLNNHPIAISPDGARLVLAGFSFTFVLDATTGAEIARVPGTPLATSPDGTRVAVLVPSASKPDDPPVGIGPSGVLRDSQIWDVTGRPKQIQTIEREAGEIFGSATFSHDGSRLAITGGSKSSVIHIWDVKTGRPVCRVPVGGTPFPSGLAFSPDGTVLAFRTEDPRSGRADQIGMSLVHFWQVGTGREIKIIGTTAPRPTALSSERIVFSPDATRVAVFEGFTRVVRIFDVTTAAELQVIRSRDGLLRAAFTPSGDRLLTADMHEAALREWEVTRAVPPLGAGPQTVPDREITVESHSGDRTAAYKFVSKPVHGAGTGDVRIRDRTGREVQVFREHQSQIPVSIPGPSPAVAFSPDDRLVLSTTRAAELKIWEADTGKVRWSFELPNPAKPTPFPRSRFQQYALGAGGRLLAQRTADGMRVVEFNDLKFRFALARAADAAFSPDGSRLISYHPATWPVAQPIDFFGPPPGGVDGWTIKLWDVASGRELWSGAGTRPSLQNGSRGVLVFSPDGRSFAHTGARAGVVEVRVLETGEKKFEVIQAHGGVASAAFSPDGSRLICWTESGFLPEAPTTWDVTTGTRLFRLEGATGYSTALYSPDGTRIVTISADGARSMLRLWDAITGRELLALSVSRALDRRDPKFSADGHRLVASRTAEGGERTIVDATPLPEAKK